MTWRISHTDAPIPVGVQSHTHALVKAAPRRFDSARTVHTATGRQSSESASLFSIRNGESDPSPTLGVLGETTVYTSRVRSAHR